MKIDFLGLKKSKKIFSKASYKCTVYIRHTVVHCTLDQSHTLLLIVHCALLLCIVLN